MPEIESLFASSSQGTKSVMIVDPSSQPAVPEKKSILSPSRIQNVGIVISKLPPVATIKELVSHFSSEGIKADQLGLLNRFINRCMDHY